MAVLSFIEPAKSHMSRVPMVWGLDRGYCVLENKWGYTMQFSWERRISNNYRRQLSRSVIIQLLNDRNLPLPQAITFQSSYVLTKEKDAKLLHLKVYRACKINAGPQCPHVMRDIKFAPQTQGCLQYGKYPDYLARSVWSSSSKRGIVGSLRPHNHHRNYRMFKVKYLHTKVTDCACKDQCLWQDKKHIKTRVVFVPGFSFILPSVRSIAT